MEPDPVQIVETAIFVREASRVLTPDELDTLRVFLALRPDAGAIVPGLAGARKLRWQAAGRGKRGGARVIYYFMHRGRPIFLLRCYGKGTKADLTSEDRNAVRAAIAAIHAEYEER